jgi:hypothetical protein
MTKAQKAHYDKIARLGCSLCRFVLKIEDSACHLHHIRRAGKRKDAPVIGLCPIHHQGSNTGIHGLGRKAFEELYSTTEEELLEKTLEIL